jgi:hypothetical protein
MPRIDSLVALSLNQSVRLVRLLTEPIPVGNTTDDPRSRYVHHRVSDSVVEHALTAALQAVIPPPLQELANRLQYRTVYSLRKRFPVLCEEILSRRKIVPRTSRLLPGTIQVPRERIEAALIEALNEDVPTNLRAIATSVGLGTARRLYKGFHDLRSAVVAKNVALRRQRGAQLRRR